MALTDYTTYADVRAALGVGDDELSDETLALDLYGLGLEAELEEVSLTLPADYQTAKDAPSQTTAQRRLVSATTLFASFAAARLALPALPLLAFKDVSDGKASDGRFSGEPYKDTATRVETAYATHRNRVLAALAVLNSETSQVALVPFMRAASANSDPVTGT